MEKKHTKKVQSSKSGKRSFTDFKIFMADKNQKVFMTDGEKTQKKVM